MKRKIMMSLVSAFTFVTAARASQYPGDGLTGIVQDSMIISTPAPDYLKALLRFEPWAESVWKAYPAIPGSGYFGDGATTGNGGIRGTCGIALAYAVLINALPNAPQRSHRLKRVEAALRYAASTHVGGSQVAQDGKKWGVLSTNSIHDPNGWQSSLWASSMGFAAALLEKDLAPSVVEECKRVVAEEADWLSKKAPGSGYLLDTKAEENAWQSNIVALAAAWMSDDPRAKTWRKVAKSYLVNTYTVPQDSSGALSKWITTQTLFPSFALENHGFYHPTYQMVAGMSLGDSYLMAEILDSSVAHDIKPFAEHNVMPVWKFLQGIVLDSGDLAFPSGLDWSLHSYEHVSYLSWLAAHFKDPQAAWAEPRLARQILYRQSVNGDGRFVGESCPDGFYREAVEARRIAMAYLQDRVAGFPLISGIKPSDFTHHYQDAGLIVQRSKKALTTVSYGPKTMTLVIPLGGRNPAQRFLISPNTETLIGGAGKTTLQAFKKTSEGFKARLSLNSRSGRTSQMTILSTPEAVIFVEVPSDTCKLPGGVWLLSAIEDDPLTGGRRELFWQGDSTGIKERSGAFMPPTTMHWMNVDGWMGFGTLSRGRLRYQAASTYNRNGAAEDFLSFQPEDLYAPRAVVLFPGMDVSQTASVMRRAKWKQSARRCKVVIAIPGQKKIRVNVPLK